MMLIERLLILPIALTTMGVANALFASDSLGVAQVAAAAVQHEPPLRPAVLIRKRSPDGLFWVPVGTKSFQFRALLDTGASGSFVNEATLAKLQLTDGVKTTPRKPQQMFVTITGRTQFPIVRINGLTVGPYTVGPVDVAVLPNDGLPNILGQDIITQLGTVKIEGDQLSFH